MRTLLCVISFGLELRKQVKRTALLQAHFKESTAQSISETVGTVYGKKGYPHLPLILICRMLECAIGKDRWHVAVTLCRLEHIKRSCTQRACGSCGW